MANGYGHGKKGKAKRAKETRKEHERRDDKKPAAEDSR